MQILKSLFTGLILLLSGNSLHAQNSWVLKKDEGGIQISTRPSDRSPFNDIRVETDLRGNIYQLASILTDADQYFKWSYSVKKSVVIQRISPTRLVYFMEINAPWPLSNRDLYALLDIHIDTVLQSLQVVTQGNKDFRPVNPDLVRIPYSKSVWNVTTVSASVIHLVYELEIDPGGTIPAWIMNLFSTKAPFETFSNLKHEMISLNP